MEGKFNNLIYNLFLRVEFDINLEILNKLHSFQNCNVQNVCNGNVMVM